MKGTDAICELLASFFKMLALYSITPVINRDGKCRDGVGLRLHPVKDAEAGMTYRTYWMVYDI
jgi:hypothetical protein